MKFEASAVNRECDENISHPRTSTLESLHNSSTSPPASTPSLPGISIVSSVLEFGWRGCTATTLMMAMVDLASNAQVAAQTWQGVVDSVEGVDGVVNVDDVVGVAGG
jgi:hypothetical protein